MPHNVTRVNMNEDVCQVMMMMMMFYGHDMFQVKYCVFYLVRNQLSVIMAKSNGNHEITNLFNIYKLI